MRFSDWSFLSALTVFSVYLVWIAAQELSGSNRSSAVQALAAVLTMLITVGLFMLNSKSEKRATEAEARAIRADERSERSEQENNRLRESAEKQAAAMQALASATSDQADLLRAQQVQDSRIRLHLLDVGQQVTMGGESQTSRRPAFVLLNLSAYSVFIQSASFQTVPGPHHAVELRINNQVAPERSALLAPGDSRQLSLPMVTGLQSFTGGGAALRAGYSIDVQCLYPGQDMTVRRFFVEWSSWRDDSTVTITPIDASGNLRPLDQANSATA